MSKDPVADNTDLYAFVSPDKPDTATILANYIPLQEPAGGPNFNTFGDDVLYEIVIDNNGDGIEDITYQFRFKTKIGNPDTFLYNTGPIGSLSDSSWNVKQFYSVTKVVGPRRSRRSTILGSDLATPPVNVGPRSTPKYADLANAAINVLSDGSTVFAGQRDEAFFVDLGAIFDLGALRPVQNFHLIPTPAAPGVDATKGFSVHSIAIQVAKNKLTSDGSNPTDPLGKNSTIGIWASASRRRAAILPGDREGNQSGDNESDTVLTGPFTQVSRLGMPLINEVIIPLGKKDFWNTLLPRFDSQFLQYYQTPELQKLLPVLYPGVFPNLAAVAESRADLIAILLTGIPAGIIPGFQNFTGPLQADYLRLNLAIPPNTTNPNRLGLVGGDPAGFPNGRRVLDDVVDIEIKAIAGATLPLVDKSFATDGAVSLVSQGISRNPTQPPNTAPFLSVFPYLPHPVPGYEHSHDP
ncbi:DUF4331 domain-containing protein [Candidatus Bathyarchaeota archaeon]|nr:MAG: DUF4331 domain-containing protein [Candidatus Bathyarchaeota archaeon]